MTALKAPSDAARQIARALGLPKNTVAFTLRVRAGALAVLEVETLPDECCAGELANVLKLYKLEELNATYPSAPPAPHGSSDPSASADHGDR